MDRDAILAWIRHLLTALGGALVLKGWTTDGMVAEVVGAVVTIIGFAWSTFDTFKKKAEVQKLEAKLHSYKLRLGEVKD